ncbi:amidohydrolase family protein [Candidatus Poriferisocius sp.]|uniref:amidohydrolase family protein n=1 Tax=Candidatus Poriferisocius sp. TaxID=3101276 RepID=UPI003B01DDF3
MNIDELILISVDDHVVEPPDLFEGRLSKRAGESAPFVTQMESGRDVWMFEGQALPNVGLNAVAGRVPEEYGLDATSFDQMRAGCYDIDERIRDMNVNGVLSSLNFPSLTGFCGQLFYSCPDKDIALELVRAYNDWHIDDWCGRHPGRMIPMVITPLWDPDLMAAEVHRAADKGCHAVSFSENPEKLGLPSFHTDHWDPFWSACCDTGTVVNLHIGSSSTLVSTASDAPIDTLITLQPMNIVLCATDLLWSPVLRKFRDLRFALSEGGIGWIPYFLERIDYTYRHHKRWTNQDFGDQLPSEVFNEQILTCFIDDAVGMEIRHHLNLNHIHWECDYPHSDSTWPNAPEEVMSYLSNLPDDDVNRITHLNAMRNYSFDPFAHIPQEDCTVGALRAQATDVDISLVSYGTGKFHDDGIVTAVTLAERMAGAR